MTGIPVRTTGFLCRRGDIFGSLIGSDAFDAVRRRGFICHREPGGDCNHFPIRLGPDSFWTGGNCRRPKRGWRGLRVGTPRFFFARRRRARRARRGRGWSRGKWTRARRGESWKRRERARRTSSSPAKGTYPNGTVMRSRSARVGLEGELRTGLRVGAGRSEFDERLDSRARVDCGASRGCEARFSRNVSSSKKPYVSKPEALWPLTERLHCEPVCISDFIFGVNGEMSIEMFAHTRIKYEIRNLQSPRHRLVHFFGPGVQGARIRFGRVPSGDACLDGGRDVPRDVRGARSITRGGSSGSREG